MLLTGRLRYEYDTCESASYLVFTQIYSTVLGLFKPSELLEFFALANRVSVAALSNRAVMIIDQVKKCSVPGRSPVSDTASKFTGFSNITVKINDVKPGPLHSHLRMTHNAPIPIAIIGIGCRFPGNVTNTETLWDLLVEGRNAWTPAPAERYNEAAFYHPKPDNSGTTNHRGGHFLNQDIAAFDAAFFAISPLEAQATDPQQRLLLEVSYEAFEDAGIPIEKVYGSDTAVYVAMFTRDYDRNIYKDTSRIPKYHVTGSGEAITSNRISYTFNLKGPSMTLDTGCSGSLVALHQACQSLRTGESSMALAAGVSLILNPDHMISMSNLGMLNEDGRSYSFDTRGSGYGRGEGASVVLLKRLDDAMQAGDEVRAIIRNSGTNQDGKTNGITLPSQQAQESLERSIYQVAGLDPHAIPYIETHGTGTSAGDLAELKGLANVFCENGRRPRKLYIGSIKSNIGHLESSSGLAGLIKTVVMLEKGQIPPNADFQSKKQSLELEEWNMRVPTKLETWPVRGKTRQASVNSFGYGGTNAHVILESAPNSLLLSKREEVNNSNDAYSPERSELSRTTAVENCNALPKYQLPSMDVCSTIIPQLFVFSARSKYSTFQLVARFKQWAGARPDSEHYFEHLAYNLSSRRSLMQWRYSFVASSYLELMVSLDQKSVHITKASDEPRVAFVFTGQGAQWFAMGRELLHTNSEFAASLTKSDIILRGLGSGWSLLNELLLDENISRIHHGDIAQPASTALQIGLVDLLVSIGIKPQVVLGHSSGEIAAAYASGILPHDVALRVSYCRSFIPSISRRLIPIKGAMLSVGLSEAEVSDLIAHPHGGIVSVACVNSPHNTTISGDEAAILEIEQTLNKMGIFNRKLKVDTAYHSHHMQTVAQHYLSSLGTIFSQSPQEGVKFISSVTAKERTQDFGAAYWVENLVSKVRFCDALQEFCRMQMGEFQNIRVHPTHIIVEIGPHSVLGGPVQQTISQGFKSFDHLYLPTLVRGRAAVHSVLQTVGKIFELGYPVDLLKANSLGFSEIQPRLIRGLPSYPWDHTNTYWHESRLSRDYRLRENPPHDLLGARIPSSTPLEPSWRHIISADTLPWLAEHMIDGLMVYPGSAYLCMAVEAMRQLTISNHLPRAISKFVLQQISFSKALIIPPAPAEIEMLINLRIQKSVGTTWYDFRIFAVAQDEAWHEHCSGRITVELLPESAPANELFVDHTKGDIPTRDELISTMRAGCSRHLKTKDMYNELRSSGNTYGPTFAAISELSINNDRATGQIRIPDVRSIMPSSYQQPHVIHPTTLDAIMHTILPVYAQHHGFSSVMPVTIQEIILSSAIPSAAGKELLVGSSLFLQGSLSATADVFVTTSEGGQREGVLAISQLEIRSLGSLETAGLGQLRMQNMVYEMKYAPDVAFISTNSSEVFGTLPITEYLNLLSFKCSQLLVLEIGARSGQSTFKIIQQLVHNGLAPIARYDVTDVTMESFQQARERLKDWDPLMRFQTLDVRQDPLEQGFETDFYDLIIATDLPVLVGHLDDSVLNMRKLLKPGGRLIFKVQEEYDTDGSILHHALLQSSFSDVQSCLDDISNKLRSGRMLISQAVDPYTQTVVDPIMIIAEEGLETLASHLEEALRSQAFHSGLTTWELLDPTDKAIFVILDNGRRPLMSNLTQERFRQVVNLLGSCSKVFWVIAQDDAITVMNPEKGLLTGLVRSARAENEDLRIITLDVQDAIGECMPNLIVKIMGILAYGFGVSVRSHQSHEAEYAYRNGRILIPRLIANSQINTWMGHATAKSLNRSPYFRSDRPLKLSMDTKTSRESLHFVHDDLTQSSLDDSSIEIAVRAHSLNSVEVQMFSTGIGDSVPVMHEFAGIICAVGLKVGDRYRVGDRVCAWTSDGVPLPSRARVDVGRVTHLPGSTSLVVGATIPIAFMAAYYALCELAHLRQGQTVLVHGADSSIGQAALTIAYHMGADILATASNTTEREAVAKRNQISLTRVFASKDPTLTQRVRESTDGHGVNVVLNSLSSESVSEIWACAAVLGTIVHMGNPWNPTMGRDTQLPGGTNVVFVPFDLPSLIRDRPQEAVGLLGRSVATLEYSSFMANQSVTEMSVTDIESAFRKLRLQKQFEKVVLVADENTEVNLLSTGIGDIEHKRTKLDPNATYVVAGGLGDLGQKICWLMASRGAKAIVVLSRRALSHYEHQALEAQLQSVSPGLRILSLACDISQKYIVDKVLSKLKTSDLPPVKGIIQSATVLQDSVLERMTFDDFRVPLQTKMSGTHHLSEAFKDSSLDFFIMLSSLSGVVGSRGQANYAAGNTFQDTLAQYHTASKTHYIALNLGMIEGTDAYRDSMGQARVKNLIRQGWVPVKHAEVLAFVEYAMSPQVRNHSCRQAAIGIDGKSIHEADSATPAMKSAMFIHVRGSYDSEGLGEKSSANTTVKESIIAAGSVTQVERIINSALSQRLSKLTMLDPDSIDLEAPLLDYGLDSLTAAELKNWIHREMEAPVQASEILDEPSISSLSMKVASRSKLIPNSPSGSPKPTAVNEDERPQVEKPNPSQKPFAIDDSHQKPLFGLPQLPLPNLEDTLDLYLRSASPFLSDKGFEGTSLAVRLFQEGLGQKLQERLLERYQDPRIDNWQHDLQVNAIYLKRRDPIHPYGTFYSSHHLTDPPHSQAERAALISAAAYAFKQGLDTGSIEQDYLNGEPTCMQSLQWLFNATRQPGIDVDKVSKYPGNNYLVALRRGHIFKIILEEGGHDVSYPILKRKFEAVLQQSRESLPSLATLSADKRGSWAKLQENIKSLSPKNSALINLINAAAFVICLDDGSPATATERCNQFLLGNPSNRWSDKSLQFVVCENGVSGYICEHSMLDAASLRQINRFITRAIVEYNVDIHKDGQVDGRAESTEEYTFVTNTSILDHIDRLQKEFHKGYSPVEFSHFRLSAVGNGVLHTKKVPSKAGIQLIIQLASLLYYEKQHPSWETVTMMPFHQGRLDWMQVVSPNMYNFCKAALDDHIPLAERLALLRDAAQSHASTLTKIARGRGFAAHLEALQEVLQQHEPVPALFKDPTWEMMRVTSTRKIKTDASEGLMAPEAGFFMPDPESVFVHYEVEDDGCVLFVQSTQGRTLPFCKALEKAEGVVKGILEA